jgi:hypothetical protein
MDLSGVRITLDLQDAYDQARASAYAWTAYAEALAALGAVCVHQQAKSPPGGGPAPCGECGRLVPEQLLPEGDDG